MADTKVKNRRLLQIFLVFAGIICLTLVFGGFPAHAQAQKTLIDLNTASEKDLESIKGVGPATAKKIIAGRPYKSVDDLKKAGVPDKTVESMKPYVKVGPASAATSAPAKAAAETKPAAPAKAQAPVKEPAKEAFPKVAPAAPAKAPAKEVPSKVTTPTPAPAKTPAADAAAASAPAKPAAEKKQTPPKEAAKTTPKAAAPAATKIAPGQKVNLNTATKEQLEALPEIGPVKAQAIIDGRPYKTPEDVMKVKGIKEGTYNKIKDSITVQ